MHTAIHGPKGTPAANRPAPTARPRREDSCWRAAARLARVGVALLVLCAGSTAFAQSPPLTVLPAAPQALQPTFVRIALPGCKTVSGVRHSDGQFALDVVGTLCGVPPPGLFTAEVSLGRLPQGEYRVRAYDADVPGRPPLGAEIRFTVAPPSAGAWPDEYAPLVDFSGTWWNPARAGEGWFVDHAVPGRMTLLWTRYDANQQPVWLWMHGTQRDYGAIRGPVYRVTGTPPNVQTTIVGEGRFIGDGNPFSGRSDLAAFVYTPTGQPPERIELQRISP
jgi:hypothetical protein